MKFLFLIFLTFVSAAPAAQYYVRGSDGNNSNTGLANNSGGAWLTIAKAAATVVAGDTVTVEAGTYNERVTESTSGSNGSPITYTASGTVTLYGFILSGSYINGSGFTFSATGIGTQDGALQLESGASNCTWTNCIHTGSVSGTEGPRGINFTLTSPPSGCTFSGWTITNCRAISVFLCGNNHTFKDSTVTGVNGWDTFNFFGTGILIQNNTVGNSNPNGLDNHPDFFQTFNAGLTVSGVIIEKNICTGSGLDDVQIGNLEDSDEDSTVTDITFRNNVFSKIPRSVNAAVPACKFYNNTFYQCGGATGSGFPVLLISNSAGHANNSEIKNNIFYECGIATTNTQQGWYACDSGLTGVVADYNLVIGTGAGTTKNNTSWTTGIGGLTGSFEAHGINGSDPLITSSSDFRLQSGSPCIGAGVVLGSFTADLVDTVRGAAWDMGAYEYTADAPADNSKRGKTRASRVRPLLK